MKCLRCGAGFDNPVPPKVNPNGRCAEIACNEWCPTCNALAAMLVHRGDSDYYVKGAIISHIGGV